MMNKSNDFMDYRHAQPESYLSKILKWLMTILAMKKRIEKSITSGKIDQAPVQLPRSLRNNFVVKETEMRSRKIWHIKPKENYSDQVIVFLHGGAYIFNMTKMHWQLIEKISLKTNASLVVPDYPLAPGAKWHEVYAFLKEVYAELLATTACENIIFMGDSAGAGLALGFAQSLRNEKKPLPQQILLISPWLDITMCNPDIFDVDKDDRLLGINGLRLAGKAYAGDLAPEDFKVSPIFGEMDGLPEVSLFIGTHDLLMPDSRLLKNKMQSANLPFNFFEYPEMYHDWVLVTNQKESRHAIEQISRLILNKAQVK